MTAHRAHAHAEAVHRNRRRTETFAHAEDLVGFCHALPFFLRLAVAQVLVDPGDQATAERDAKVGSFGSGQRTLFGDHLAVDFQNGALGVVQQILNFGVQRAVLRQEFAHVLGAAAGGGLVSLGAHPFDQTCLVQRAHTHQHAADGAVAADPFLAALGQRVLDDRHVDRVEDDDGVLFHAQGGRGIDPVAVPAGGAQLGIHGVGVVTALAGDDDLAALEGVDAVRVLQRGFVPGHCGRLAASIRGGEEQRFDQVEVLFFNHAIHQHRADHAAPANQTYQLAHFNRPFRS